MTAFMDRSIDLIEEIARATDNRFHLNRRGYVFATADAAKIAFLSERWRSSPKPRRRTGALSRDPVERLRPVARARLRFRAQRRRRDHRPQPDPPHFPYLSPETVAVAHARRAGWLSAQQLGIAMLEAARERGVKLVRGKVVGIDIGERVRAVTVEQDGERRSLEATHFVLAAGPMQKEIAPMVGVDFPIIAERHLKISFADTHGAYRARRR